MARYGTPGEPRAIMWRYRKPGEIGFGVGARAAPVRPLRVGQ